MIVQYTGIRRINGPLIVLSGVENVAYDELVEIHLNDGTMRMGNVVAVSYTHLEAARTWIVSLRSAFAARLLQVSRPFRMWNC